MAFRESNHPRRNNIILFIIGAAIFLGALTGATELADLFKVGAFKYLSFIGLIGLGLQITAVFRLKEYDNRFIVSMVAIFIDVIFVVTYLIFSLINTSNGGFVKWVKLITDISDYGMSISETVLMVFFVLGVNEICGKNYNFMPTLTKVIVVAYIVCSIINVVLPALGTFGVTLPDNKLVDIIIDIAGISYLVREISIIIFLISAVVIIKD